MTESGAHAELLNTIAAKRSEIASFLAGAVPAQRRLVNLAITCSALASGLTGAPALGGQSVTEAMATTLELDAPAWRLLCLAAALCSIVATIATGLSRAGDSQTRIQRAQGCEARLEAIETQLKLEQISVSDATERYVAAIENVSLI